MSISIITLGILTIFVKLLGLAREIVLSYYYGASHVSDAFLISYTIPGTLFSIISVVIATGFIPIFTSILVKEGEKNANDFLSKVLIIVITISSLLTLISLFFSNQIVSLFISSDNLAQLELTSNLTNISILSLLFIGICNVLTSYLQLQKKFMVVVLLGMPLNLSIIVFIYLSFVLDKVELIAWGLVVSPITQLMFLFFFMRKQNYRFKIPNFKIDNNIKGLFLFSVPMFISIIFSQINLIIDRNLASKSQVGAISALNYSNRLVFFIQSISITTVLTVVFPILSRLIAEKKTENFKKMLDRTTFFFNVITIPLIGSVLLFSNEIVSLVYQRGAFSIKDSVLTNSIFVYYIIGLYGIAFRELYLNALYALQESKSAMLNSVISIIINIILSIILFNILGLIGIAIATAFSVLLCAVLLYFSLKRKIKIKFFETHIRSLFFTTLSTIFMLFYMKLLYSTLENKLEDIFNFILVFSTGYLLYFIVLKKMNLREMQDVSLMNFISVLIKRRKNNY